MKAKLFFLILLLPFRIPLVNSATDEGYGEANENLGQFTDTFENDDNVTVMYQVINNVTLECMELNFTSDTIVYEDFTTYTEVDEDGDLTITATKIDISTMRRDAETYVWKDFNPDYFGDFEHLFKVSITDLEAGDFSSASISVFSLMTNSTPAVMDDLQASNWLGVMIHQQLADDDKYGFRVWQREGGATTYISGVGLIYDVNDPIYVTFNRTGTSIGLFIFDSEARTNLIESHTGVGNGKTYRYLEPLANSGRDADGADWYTGYIEDLTLGEIPEGYELEGYFTTEDYLNYTTGQGLALLTNASVPIGTSMTVQFSSDKITWVDNHGDIGSTTLSAGFFAIDLRDLNYSDIFIRGNLSGPGGTVTPRLYQLRIVTTKGTEGAPGDGVTVIESDAPWIAIAIILSIIALLLAGGYKR